MYMPITMTTCVRGMTHLRTCIDGVVNHVAISREAGGTYFARWTVGNIDFRRSLHHSRGHAIDWNSEALLSLIRATGLPSMNRDS